MTRQPDSPFWKGFKKIKENFFSAHSFNTGNGENISLGGYLARG
jgi:hypothetical protein